MKIEIVVSSNHVSISGEESMLADLSKQLEANPAFKLRRPLLRERTVDPTIVAALVGAFGTVMGTLIGSLIQIAQRSESKLITIWLKNGCRIDVPASTPPDELDRLIEELDRSEDKPSRIIVP